MKEQDNKPNINNEQQDSNCATAVVSEPLNHAKSSSKKRLFYNIFLIVAIAVGLFFMVKIATSLSDEGIASFDTIIASLDWTFVLVAIALVLVTIALDSFKYQLVITTIEGKAKYKTSLKTSLLGKYYDNITPFSTGGQPMQIYYLHKKGHSGGSSGAIVAVKYFANTFAWLVVGVALMCNVSALANVDGATSNLLLWLGWVGWVLNASIPVMIIFFVVAPKGTERLVKLVVKLGNKLRIVKDIDKTMDRAHKIVDDFRHSFVIMKNNPLRFFALVLMCFVVPIITYAFPYFVMLSLGSATFDINLLITIMTLNVYSAFASSISPTPGASGVVETFMMLVMVGFTSAEGFWVVFLWRFFIYYIYIIIGVFITMHDLIRSHIRSKKDKQKQQ